MLVEAIGNAGWVFDNEERKVIINPDYQTVFPFSEEGFPIGYYPKRNKFILINTKGEELEVEGGRYSVKEFTGCGARGFSDGIMVIRQGLCGAINIDRKIIVPCKYDYLSVFSNGYSVGRLNGELIVLAMRFLLNMLVYIMLLIFQKGIQKEKKS